MCVCVLMTHRVCEPACVSQGRTACLHALVTPCPGVCMCVCACVRVCVHDSLRPEGEGSAGDGGGQVEALGDLPPDLLVDDLHQASLLRHQLVELV